MLERYRLEELDAEDKKIMEEALAVDSGLREHLERLDKSDRDLRLRYPFRNFGIPVQSALRPSFVMKIAAVLLLCLMFPVIYFLRNNSQAEPSVAEGYFADTVRIKGAVQEGSRLSLYLKGDSENPLADKTALGEGNTVQLAYTAPAGNEYYGVIFSIDGRYEVTMHYPYRMGQSSILDSGKRTFLNEAYTLDDAPDYEVFVMVVSAEVLDAVSVLAKARSIAGAAAIEEESKTVFTGCEVQTVTVLKK